MKNIWRTALVVAISIFTSCADKRESNTTTDKEKLIQLEYNWLKAEFALDTAFLSTIIDSTFMTISENGVNNKQESLLDMYNNISQRLKDSIVVDSFNLENTRVNLYGDFAVVTLVVHTNGKNKTAPTERRTRFYDVWIRREDKWKAIASEGTKIQADSGQAYYERKIIAFTSKYNFKTFATKIFKGKLAAPDFSGNEFASDTEYVKFITEGCKDNGINFGGHYTIIEKSCGTMCEGLFIVDRKTGKVFTEMKPNDGGRDGYLYRDDSKLLIANSNLFVDDSLKHYSDLFGKPELWVWTGNTFKQLK